MELWIATSCLNLAKPYNPFYNRALFNCLSPVWNITSLSMTMSDNYTVVIFCLLADLSGGESFLIPFLSLSLDIFVSVVSRHCLLLVLVAACKMRSAQISLNKLARLRRGHQVEVEAGM